MSILKFIGVLVLAFVIVAGAVSCGVSVWRDCRTEHGVLYCMKVLGR